MGWGHFGVTSSSAIAKRWLPCQLVIHSSPKVHRAFSSCLRRGQQALHLLFSDLTLGTKTCAHPGPVTYSMGTDTWTL